MNLKKAIILSLCALFVASLAGCKSGSGRTSTLPAPDPNRIVYLKNNIHVQMKQGRDGDPLYRASYANFTDPGRGHMIIPVNTKVTIRSYGGSRGREILITTLKDKKNIHFEYNRRNIKLPMEEYFDYITSTRAVALKGLSKIDRKGIAEGKPYVGMTKKGIRIALGYPSPHRTPSLKHNEWTYWRNRFRTMRIKFSGKGRVKEIIR